MMTNALTDEQAVREILATIAIPSDYEFTCFAIKADQKLNQISWRDITDHMDEPIYIVLKSRAPKGASVFDWKLMECQVINASVN